MAEGSRRQAWDHTSRLLAAVINSNPYRSGEAVTARELNPYAPKLEPIVVPISALRDVFLGKPT